jgi:hypothetical protein
MLICVLGFVVAFLFLALEVRHHHWWKYYEGSVIDNLEKLMYVKDVRQYPNRADFDRREFVKKGLLGITATHATYGICISSLIFFVIVFI